MKQKQAQQILNLQQQVAAMEQEIEQLYAERRRLVQESELLLTEALQTEEPALNGVDYQSELDQILNARAESRFPKHLNIKIGSFRNSLSLQQFIFTFEIFYTLF